MRPVALCYSPVDAGAATELRSYLETNCPVAMEDGVVQMGADLLDSVETGLSFDYVLVLLSPQSTEPAWPRTVAFAYARHTDFEAVVWLNAARRGRVGVLGDVAFGLGLRLEGTWEDNAHALTEYCADHRVLLVFENLESGVGEIVNFGGKASVVIVDGAHVPLRRPLSQLQRLFSSWKRNASKCLEVLGDVESHLDSPEILKEEIWTEACTLCSAAVALLKDYGRLAEAYDLLARISSAMQVRGDLAALGQAEWETSWILEHWDQPVQIPGRMAAALSEPTQLTLF